VKACVDEVELENVRATWRLRKWNCSQLNLRVSLDCRACVFTQAWQSRSREVTLKFTSSTSSTFHCSQRHVQFRRGNTKTILRDCRGVRRKFSWGVSFSGIWRSFVFSVRCLWRHNL